MGCYYCGSEDVTCRTCGRRNDIEWDIDIEHMMQFIAAQIDGNAKAAIASQDARDATWSRGVVEGLGIIKRYVEERRSAT